MFESRKALCSVLLVQARSKLAVIGLQVASDISSPATFHMLLLHASDLEIMGVECLRKMGVEVMERHSHDRWRQVAQTRDHKNTHILQGVVMPLTARYIVNTLLFIPRCIHLVATYG